MTIDELLTPDLDDLLTFRLYLAQMHSGQPGPVTAAEAVAACDNLLARLSAQRWIAVRGAEQGGESPAEINSYLEQARAKARAKIEARIAASQS